MSEVDAVILWVDGSDPELAKKRAAYSGELERSRDDLAAPTRFASVGEIHWCVRSINRFAPWIRKIWIVTDSQDPHVESAIPVEIVDHSVIYRGYESMLPVFNSISIESMIWRIPGLSEKFLYFNDDLALAAPVSEEDFFTADGRVVFYGGFACTPWIRLLRDLKPKKHGQRMTTVKHSLLRSVEVAGRMVPKASALRLSLAFPFPEHTPKALLRSFYEDIASSDSELLPRNASFRFRDLAQFRADALLPMVLLSRGLCEMRSCRDSFLYFKPRKASKGVEAGLAYFEKKFARCDGGACPCDGPGHAGTSYPAGSDGVKFLCLNSLDEACPEVLARVREWIDRRLGGC